MPSGARRSPISKMLKCVKIRKHSIYADMEGWFAVYT
jgi:hypothetical protein